jgi:maltose O-acetyltransferase
MMRFADRAQIRLRQLRYAVRGTPTAQVLRDYGATVGRHVFLGNGTYVDEGFAWLVTIEDDVTLAPSVHVLAHDAGLWEATGYTRVAEVRIEEKAYIGAGAIIMPGVTVGREAVVGAGSVVTRDVAPRTVVAGVPARFVRSVDALVDAHRAPMDAARRDGAFGWSRQERVTAAGREAVRARVRAVGQAYVP